MRIKDLIEGESYSYKFAGQAGYGIYSGRMQETKRDGKHVVDRKPILLLSDGTETAVCSGSMILFPKWPNRLAEGAKLNLLSPKQRKKWGKCVQGLMIASEAFEAYVGEQETVRFATWLEVWFLGHIEGHHIAWSYEERLFEFYDGSGFCPDFYLPEIDTYVELTCQTRSDKAGKLSRMKRQYPKINVVCLDRRKMTHLASNIDDFDGDQLLDYLTERIESKTDTEAALQAALASVA